MTQDPTMPTVDELDPVTLAAGSPDDLVVPPDYWDNNPTDDPDAHQFVQVTED
jgi:hypothetical protein